MDNYQYETAIKYEKRSFLRIFFICLLSKENIINLIFYSNPLNLKILQIILFIFVFSSDLALNTIFYSNSNISDKYHYEGDNIYFYTMVNSIVESLSSAIISLALIILSQYLIDSRRNFEILFRTEEEKMRKNRKYKVSKKKKVEISKKINEITTKLKYKIIIFIGCEFSLMLFFYYFVTAFCEIYKKTQINWILNFIVSFFFSLFTELFFAWVLTLLYITSIRYKINCIYKIALFIYNL